MGGRTRGKVTQFLEGTALKRTLTREFFLIAESHRPLSRGHQLSNLRRLFTEPLRVLGSAIKN